MNVEKALRALRENGFDARWFATAAEAADALCAEVKGKTVADDLARAAQPPARSVFFLGDMARRIALDFAAENFDPALAA